VSGGCSGCGRRVLHADPVKPVFHEQLGVLADEEEVEITEKREGARPGRSPKSRESLRRGGGQRGSFLEAQEKTRGGQR